MARLRLLRLVWIFVKLLLPHKSSTYKFVCIQLTTDVWLMGGSGFACSTADVGLTASRIHTSSLVGDHVNGSVAAAGHCWKSILWQQGSRTVLWVITRDLHALERYHSHTFFFLWVQFLPSLCPSLQVKTVCHLQNWKEESKKQWLMEFKNCWDCYSAVHVCHRRFCATVLWLRHLKEKKILIRILGLKQ